MHCRSDAACTSLRLAWLDHSRPPKEKVIMKMRFYALFCILVSLGLVAALAQDTVSTSGQSLQGTWISQVADPGGSVALFEVGTYYPDGSYTGSNVNPSHTTHQGVWLRVGDRKFIFTFMFFTHDDKGVFNGIIKARGIVTLSADLQSYDSQVERVVMDATGKELQVISGITGHSVRMNVEMQKNPPPQ